MKRILGLDPGGTTGWSLVERKSPREIKTLQMGEVKEPDIYAFLDTWPLLVGENDLVVVEEFTARPNFTDGRWTKLPVAELVGMCRLRAKQLGCHLIKTQPSMLDIGYRSAGLTRHKSKNTSKNAIYRGDAFDANAHAWYVATRGFTPAMKEF